ncbi:MAG: hypothetical protein R3C19_19365 [Planctomycetaceae bacterium]
MSRSMGNVIGDSLALSLGYAERLLKDIPQDQFARFARPGGQVVESNHPAFVYGHLSLYAPRILQQLGHSAPEIPELYQQIFAPSASCADDTDGTIYPSRDDITSRFFDGYRAALDALRQADDGEFQKPNPLERMMEKFPTVGSMHAFYVGGHMMIHMGQISAWRRMTGLGAA